MRPRGSAVASWPGLGPATDRSRTFRVARSHSEQGVIRTKTTPFKDSPERFCRFPRSSYGLKIRVSVVQLRPWAPFFLRQNTGLCDAIARRRWVAARNGASGGMAGEGV